MERAHPPDIIPSTLEEVATAIREIESLDLRSCSIEESRAKLKPFFQGYIVVAPIFNPGMLVFRARKVDEHRPELLSEIAAPPAPKSLVNQRCNRSGQPLFYCSSDRSGPFFELHAREGDRMVLSTWKTTKPLLTNRVGFTPAAFTALGSVRECPKWGSDPEKYTETELNQKIENFLAEKFTQDIHAGEEDLYKLTIAITEELIPGELFGGLLYPTIPMNGNGDNLALKPAFVSGGLSFVRAEYLVVKRIEGMKMEFDVLDTAISSDENDSILWKGHADRWTLKKKGDMLTFTAENGRWVVRDPSGNLVEPD